MAKFNAYLGAASSAWLLAILIIAAELFTPLKDFLKNTFSHHWIGKAVLVALSFLIFGFIFKERQSIGAYSDDQIGWYSVVVSLILIIVFFFAHYFVQ